MAKSKGRERDVERTVSRATFVKTLRRLADALEENENVSIQIKGERLRIPREADLSIEHEREGGTEELELQLKWKRVREK